MCVCIGRRAQIDGLRGSSEHTTFIDILAALGQQYQENGNGRPRKSSEQNRPDMIRAAGDFEIYPCFLSP